MPGRFAGYTAGRGKTLLDTSAAHSLVVTRRADGADRRGGVGDRPPVEGPRA